jgi:hypothetical protein
MGAKLQVVGIDQWNDNLEDSGTANNLLGSSQCETQQ